MCISGEIHDKWPPLIEFFIWLLLQAVCIGSHYGVWAIIPANVIDVTSPTYKNVTFDVNITTFNDTKLCIIPIANLTTDKNCTGMEAVINEYPIQQWENLLVFRHMLLIFSIIATVVFVIHAILLLPNIVQGFRVKEPTLLKETGNGYFRNILKIHCAFLILETLTFDIPAGCLSMEIISQVWEGPLTQEENMRVSKIILTLSLVGLAFVSMYKGMYVCMLRIFIQDGLFSSHGELVSTRVLRRKF